MRASADHPLPLSKPEVEFRFPIFGFPNSDVRILRKEVIQPQVPLRLPCYDFIPITNHTLGTYLPCGSKQRLRVQSAFMM